MVRLLGKVPWCLPEALTDDPRSAIDRPVLTQEWLDVTFLHWPIRPGVVAPLLPAGTRPDTIDGWTYVGLVPFRMQGLAFGGLRPVPYLGSFLECNVRLYTVDRQGRRGVVFLTLESDRLVPGLVARAALGLPYRWAGMTHLSDGPTHHWRSASRSAGPGRAMDLTVRTASTALVKDELDRFLTDRWGLHTRRAGATWYMATDHDPWPLREAGVVDLQQHLTSACGLPPLRNPVVRVAYAPRVRVRFGLPVRVV